MRGTRWFAIGAVVAVLVSLMLLAAACGDDEEDGADATPTEADATEPATDTTPAEGAIDIALSEYEVVADPASAAAGSVTFNITNEGDEPHEFVVISTDLDPSELPTATDGSVDETQAGMTVIDEVEDIQAGASEELTVSLDAGSYALICNLVETTGELHAHYEEGMFTAFDVTE